MLELTEANLLPAEYFCIPEHYKDDISSILIPSGMLVDRIAKLAEDIDATYKGLTAKDPLVCICVLKGSHVFFSKLLDRLNLPIRPEFITVSSYSGTESTGKVKFSIDGINISGKHVLVVEDIIDTGLTLTQLSSTLNSMNAKSVKIASLLIKRTDKSNGFKGDFVGFSIPDVFVLGCGLDYNQVFRDLKHIGVISKSAISKYASSA